MLEICLFRCFKRPFAVSEEVAAKAKEIFGAEAEVFYREDGAPVIKNRENAFLSAAHSNEVAVAVFSDRPVGVDIEWIRPFNHNVLKRLLPSERQFVGKGDERSFFEVFTFKEAAAKMSGIPLAQAFDSVCAVHNGRMKKTFRGARAERVFLDNYVITIMAR